MKRVCSVTVYNRVGFLCPLPKRHLEKLLKHMLATQMELMHDLVLYVVDDGGIMDLQKKHMNCQGPTNILSFPSGACSNSSFNALPHTLILSVHTLQRECLLYGQNVDEHLVRLLAHGIGHIAGYDHGPEMSALCEKLERRGYDFLQSGAL